MGLITERVTINPVVEDPTLVPLDLVGLDRSWGIYLLEHDYPAPDLDVLHSSSADTEGDLVVSSRYLNRIITAKVRVFEPSDPASTNFATNPSAELATTGWGGVSLVAGPTRVLPTSPPPGLGIDTAVEAQTNAAGDYVYHEVAVTNGKTYRFSVYVQLRAKVGALALQAVVYNAAGAVKKATGAAKVEAVELGAEWVRLDVAFTADATASWRVGVEQTAGTSATFYATAVLIEESATLGPYFDGDTPGCDWSGARSASPSTRPAPDGTRFSRICRDVTRILDGIKARRSGVLRRISALGGPLYYDLRTAKLTDAPQNIGIGMKRAEYALAFEALPGGRGPEVQIGGNFDELAKPALTFLAENIPGEMPALGRLILEDRQGQNQLAAWWGAQRDTYSSSADAELFYEAETRKALGGSTVEALAGASGPEGKAVKSGSLVNGWQAVVSTQASVGNHLAHVGTYRVLARVFRPESNTGKVSVKLQWTEGDFTNTTTNDTYERTFGANEAEGHFQIVDLGLVTINQVPSGTQRWEGRVLGKSTVAGDRVYVDCFALVPASEGAGEARASSSLPAPTVLGAFDLFNQTAGALAGKSADIGGVYAGAGDTDDFTVEAGSAKRTAVSDVAGTPRYEILGATTYNDVSMRLNVYTNNSTYEFEDLRMGFIVRYIDVNNWLALVVTRERGEVWPGVNADSYYTQLWKKVAGVKTQIPGALIGLGTYAIPAVTAVGFGLWMVVLSNGEWRVGASTGIGSQATAITRVGVDTALNATGALKEGKVGLFDEKTSASAETRLYDNLEAYAPTIDASVFANRQLEIRADQARRQDKEGLTWGTPPYEGDYMLVPQSGPEKKPVRFLVKASRNPDSDDGIDDIRANLFVTPRYLLAPPT